MPHLCECCGDPLEVEEGTEEKIYCDSCIEDLVDDDDEDEDDDEEDSDSDD